MANDLNQCNFTGRLGKDPDVRQAGSGKVANFSIAVGEQWRDRQTQEKKEKTTWVNVVVWGNGAETVEKFFAKGTFVRVTGKLQTRQYEQDGQTRYATEILADQLQILSGWKGDQNGSGQQQGGQQQRQQSQPQQQRPQQQQQRSQQPGNQPPTDFDDDIPF